MRRELDRLEFADPEEIKRYQERRLRALVRVAAARSPFYRQYFRESGVDHRAIRTLADLTLLPVLSREHLMMRPADFCTYPRRLMWAARSSGTSGEPVTCYRTPGSSMFELSALERQWRWFGVPNHSRRVILRGSDFSTDPAAGLTKHIVGARQLLVSSFHLVADNLDAIMADISAFEPDAIEGWPSSIALLAHLLRDRGQRFPVKAVITSSENMTPGRIQLLEDVFEAPVVDHYGQTERAVLAGCCERGGYHIFPDYSIVELVEMPNARGRWEMIGTPLHNWGFPLFRYRVGDAVTAVPGQQCACGRNFPLIGSIEGRVEDSFTAADGRPLPLPSTVVDGLQGVREAQIAQLDQGKFEVRVVPGVDFDAALTEAAVHHTVERLFGTGQDTTFTIMERIPRSAGGKLKAAVVEGGRANEVRPRSSHRDDT
jgi:phenylacetate-CoA ligase